MATEYTWQHISFQNGSNPYICKTSAEFAKMQKKYKKQLVNIKDNMWIVQLSFNDIKVGDTVVCYDEYNHDYIEHRLLITEIEYEREYVTDTNPSGKVCYGDDLNAEEFGDDYISVVTEGNFCRIVK